LAVLGRAQAAGPLGAYGLQAAIAAEHARAADAAATNWAAIVEAYRRLLTLEPTPVVELNFAAAVGMAEGPLAGLRLLDVLAERPELSRYHLLPAARADLLRRAGRRREAEEAYRRAIELVQHAAERRFLERRLAELGAHAPSV
jgi:RNA polymerase sigma-70 factor (ECF subfamily)